MKKIKLEFKSILKLILFIFVYFSNFILSESINNEIFDINVIRITDTKIKITWNVNFTTGNDTRYRIEVYRDDFNKISYYWPAQLEKISFNEDKKTIKLLKIDYSSFDCFDNCINDIECKQLTRIHPNNKNDGTSCYLKNNEQAEKIEDIPDAEYFKIKDYSNETEIDNLPYGYKYKFRVEVIVDKTSVFSNLTELIDLTITWSTPNITRIGFKTVNVEWKRNENKYLISRLGFVVNNEKINYKNFNWEKDLLIPNYYEYKSDNWINKIIKNENDCKKSCEDDPSCLFVIHFYRKQSIAGNINTENRLPLNADLNTCILRYGLNIEYGTQKDNATNIYYYISKDQYSIKQDFNINLNNEDNTFQLLCKTPYGSDCNSVVHTQKFKTIEGPLLSFIEDFKNLKVNLSWSIDNKEIPTEKINGSKIKITENQSGNQTGDELIFNDNTNETTVDIPLNQGSCYYIALKDIYGSYSEYSTSRKCSALITLNSTVIKTSEPNIFVETGKAEFSCDYSVIFDNKPFEINENNVINKTIWYKNGAEINIQDLNLNQNGKKLIFNKLDQKLHNGSYSCGILFNNKQTIKSKNEIPIEIYKLIPKIVNIDQVNSNEIKFKFNVENRDKFSLKRYRLFISNDSNEWPAQWNLNIGDNINDASLEDVETNNLFDCFSKCINNKDCIAVRTDLIDEKKIKCSLKNIVEDYTNEYVENTKSFILNVEDFKDEFSLSNLPYGKIYNNFLISVYDEDSDVWSDKVEINTIKIDMSIKLKLTGYKQIGIKKVNVEWKQENEKNYNYTISRFNILINGIDDDNYKKQESLDTYELEPYYYESVKITEMVNSRNETDCEMECFKNSKCVQYVFLKKNETCYLKTNLNIFNGLLIDPENKNITVKSIKCNSNSYTHNANSNNYNLKVTALTPYGDGIVSNDINIKLDEFKPILSVDKVDNKQLSAKLNWDFDTKSVVFNKYAIIQHNNNSDFYYITKNNIKNLYLTSFLDLKSCYKKCFDDPFCFYFSYSQLTNCTNETLDYYEKCPFDKTCVKMNKFEDNIEIKELFVNTKYVFSILINDEYGETISTEKTEIIEIPFSVNSKIDKDEPTENENAKIDCYFDDIDTENLQSIEWFKNNNKINSNNNDNITINKNGMQIEFTNLNHVIHNGAYKCKVVLITAQDFISNITNITVRFGPNLSFKINNNENKIQSVYENSSVTFDCNMEGYPTPSIKLFYDNNQIDKPFVYDNFNNKILFKYEKISRTKNGTYSCASNYSEISIDFLVYYPAELKSLIKNPINNEYYSIYDKDNYISCSVDSYSEKKSKIKWKKDGYEINNITQPNFLFEEYFNETFFSSKINFNPSKTTKEDSGEYICFVFQDGQLDLNDKLSKKINLIFKSRAETPKVLNAIRLAEGVNITWEQMDYGGFDNIKVKYEWENSSNLTSGEVNIIKDDFSILITNLTNDAKEISISIINDLGYSEKSLFISIQCGYKGCEPPTNSPNIAGIVSGVLIGVLFAFILIGSVIYYKRNHTLRFWVKKPQQNNNLNFNHPNNETKNPIPMTPIPKPTSQEINEIIDIDNQMYTIESFYNHWLKNQETIENELKNQFNRIYNPEVKNLPNKFNESFKPFNRDKLRFGNVLPYDSNRVILTPIQNIEGSDYINASSIKDTNDIDKYIAAQAPKSTTVDDFWRMIVEKKVKAIVMLANFYQKNRRGDLEEQCYPYWDDSNDQNYGNVKVNVIKVENNLVYVKREFEVTNLELKQGRPIYIDHYHFTKWPDLSVPDEAQSLLALVSRVKNEHQNEAPILVHCSAGVGRTGTYIAIDSLMDKIKTFQNINIFKLVNNLREQRVLMVQKPEQYLLVHTALIENYLYANSLMKKPKYNQEFHQVLCKKKDPYKNKLLIQVQFDNIGEFDEKIRTDKIARKHPNIFMSPFRPYDVDVTDQNCSILLATVDIINNDPTTCYYDATLFQSSQIDAQFIVACDPINTNIKQFLRLIRKYRPEYILSMTSSDLYFPQNGFINIDNTTITLERKEKENNINIYTLLFKFDNNSNEDLKIKFINTKEIWPLNNQYPENVSEYNRMINTILCQLFPKDVKLTMKPLVLVHSNDAGDRCGILVASILLLNRIRIHEQFDVVLVVRLLRRMRFNIISTLEAFKFLYTSSVQYLDKLKTFNDSLYLYDNANSSSGLYENNYYANFN